MKKQLLILSGFLHLSLWLSAQGINVSAATDKNSIVIGEQFTLTINELLPKGKNTAFFSLDSLPHFEIINKSKPDSQVTAGGIFIEQKLTLTSWDSGRWPIPSLAIGKFKTKPVFITVSYAPFNAAQPYHDVKEIIEVRKPPESKWWWYVFGIACLVVLFILFFPKEKKSPATVFVADEGAYKEALKKLTKLKSAAVNQEDKLFYTELVNIFREYLAKRKNIQSYSKTSDDLVKHIDELKISGGLSGRLIETLRLSDLVKFARYQPSAPENETAINNIEKTIIEIENNRDAV